MVSSDELRVIATVLSESDPIDNSVKPDFGVIARKVVETSDHERATRAVRDIIFGDFTYETKSSALGVLYELDGPLAARLMLLSYVDRGVLDPIWIIQMSARSSSDNAKRFLESLVYFELDESNRAEIINSLGDCGDKRSIEVLESVVKWDDGYSWEGVEIRSIAKASIAHIKMRLGISA